MGAPNSLVLKFILAAKVYIHPNIYLSLSSIIIDFYREKFASNNIYSVSTCNRKLQKQKNVFGSLIWRN